jgi:hypothetical protein
MEGIQQLWNRKNRFFDRFYSLKKRIKECSGTPIIQVSHNTTCGKLHDLQGLRWKRSRSSRTGEIVFLTDFMVKKPE